MTLMKKLLISGISITIIILGILLYSKISNKCRTYSIHEKTEWMTIQQFHSIKKRWIDECVKSNSFINERLDYLSSRATVADEYSLTWKTIRRFDKLDSFMQQYIGYTLLQVSYWTDWCWARNDLHLDIFDDTIRIHSSPKFNWPDGSTICTQELNYQWGKYLIAPWYSIEVNSRPKEAIQWLQSDITITNNERIGVQ